MPLNEDDNKPKIVTVQDGKVIGVEVQSSFGGRKKEVPAGERDVTPVNPVNERYLRKDENGIVIKPRDERGIPAGERTVTTVGEPKSMWKVQGNSIVPSDYAQDKLAEASRKDVFEKEVASRAEHIKNFVDGKLPEDTWVKNVDDLKKLLDNRGDRAGLKNEELTKAAIDKVKQERKHPDLDKLEALNNQAILNKTPEGLVLQTVAAVAGLNDGTIQIDPLLAKELVEGSKYTPETPSGKASEIELYDTKTQAFVPDAGNKGVVVYGQSHFEEPKVPVEDVAKGIVDKSPLVQAAEELRKKGAGLVNEKELEVAKKAELTRVTDLLIKADKDGNKTIDTEEARRFNKFEEARAGLEGGKPSLIQDPKLIGNNKEDWIIR